MCRKSVVLGQFAQTYYIPRYFTWSKLDEKWEPFLRRSVETVRLTINIQIHLQHDPWSQIFSEQLLDIGNDKIELYSNTQCIKLPVYFRTIAKTKHELIESVFPAILHNYFYHNWFSEHAILVAKNLDIDEIYFQVI